MRDYNIVIDVHDPSRYSTIDLKRGDKNTANIIITLLNDGEPLDLTDTMTATIKGVKPDKTIIYADATIDVDNSKITWVVDENAASVAGKSTYELNITDEDLSEVTTANFYIHVENLLYDETDYLSADDLSGFKSYMTRTFLAEQQAEAEVAKADEEIAKFTNAYGKVEDIIDDAETLFYKLRTTDFTGAQGPKGDKGDSGIGIIGEDITSITYEGSDLYATIDGNKEDLGRVKGDAWYTGTAITGSSTTPTIYDTDIENAYIGDFYLNTDNANVYSCTQSGDASTALWVYNTNIRGVQAEVIDDLETPSAEKALSANQGKVLKEQLDGMDVYTNEVITNSYTEAQTIIATIDNVDTTLTYTLSDGTTQTKEYTKTGTASTIELSYTLVDGTTPTEAIVSRVKSSNSNIYKLVLMDADNKTILDTTPSLWQVANEAQEMLEYSSDVTAGKVGKLYKYLPNEEGELEKNQLYPQTHAEVVLVDTGRKTLDAEIENINDNHAYLWQNDMRKNHTNYVSEYFAIARETDYQKLMYIDNQNQLAIASPLIVKDITRNADIINADEQSVTISNTFAVSIEADTIIWGDLIVHDKSIQAKSYKYNDGSTFVSASQYLNCNGIDAGELWIKTNGGLATGEAIQNSKFTASTSGYVTCTGVNAQSGAIKNEGFSASASGYVNCEGLNAGKSWIQTDGGLSAKGTYNSTTSTTANVVVGSDGNFSRHTSSSQRYKENIKELDLDTIKPLYDIPVKTFNYKEGYMATDDERYKKDIIGFIAEEINSVAPIAVDHNQDGTCEVWNSEIMIPILLGLIQDLNKRVKELENE